MGFWLLMKASTNTQREKTRVHKIVYHLNTWGEKKELFFFRIKKHQHFVAAKKVRNMCLDKLTS